MPNHITQISHSFSILDKPICLPIKIILLPVTTLIHIVKRVVQTFFGYLLKLGVFPFGSMNRSWLRRKIIEVYQGGCYDTHDRSLLNPKRLNQAFKILENVGGIRSKTFCKDGTKLDTMILRYQDVKSKIERRGGKFVSLPISIDNIIKEGRTTTTHCSQSRWNPQEYVDLIIPSEDRDIHEWENFCKDVLTPSNLERAEVKLTDGRVVAAYILKHWDANKPIIRPKPGQLFVRCNAPTESYAMAKRDILRHVLGLDADVLCFDYPGTWASEGEPSEGAYYLSAETMVEKAANEYGYAFKDIWATGFCLGGAVVGHLKRKYHDQGINICTQNAFNCLYDTVRLQVWPANILSPIAMPELKSKNPQIIDLVDQDSFNTIGKFYNLAPSTHSKGGISVIINTDTDTTVPKTSHQQLVDAVSGVSKKTFPIFFAHPNKNKNGHSYDVLGERVVWDKFAEAVIYKDHPNVLQSSNPLYARMSNRFWNLLQAS